jgi:hypothetical protein
MATSLVLISVSNRDGTKDDIHRVAQWIVLARDRSERTWGNRHAAWIGCGGER